MLAGRNAAPENIGYDMTNVNKQNSNSSDGHCV